MQNQNQSPEHRPLHQPDDPSTVIPDAEKLHNSDREPDASPRPILTPNQLIGFLKAETPLEFEREKIDCPLS